MANEVIENCSQIFQKCVNWSLIWMHDSNVAQYGLTKSKDSIIEASIPFYEREGSRKLSGCGLQNKF